MVPKLRLGQSERNDVVGKRRDKCLIKLLKMIFTQKPALVRSDFVWVGHLLKLYRILHHSKVKVFQKCRFCWQMNTDFVSASNAPSRWSRTLLPRARRS